MNYKSSLDCYCLPVHSFKNDPIQVQDIELARLALNFTVKPAYQTDRTNERKKAESSIKVYAGTLVRFKGINRGDVPLKLLLDNREVVFYLLPDSQEEKEFRFQWGAPVTVTLTPDFDAPEYGTDNIVSGQATVTIPSESNKTPFVISKYK